MMVLHLFIWGSHVIPIKPKSLQYHSKDVFYIFDGDIHVNWAAYNDLFPIDQVVT
jgi:hypothetical protein